jgi:hypothetical protein
MTPHINRVGSFFSRRDIETRYFELLQNEQNPVTRQTTASGDEKSEFEKVNSNRNSR